ncbi:hypothetical protein PGTUg99_021547 [Puccinia graminis f. sp. tritici]|uniref:Uncharacterized protein n=1 Tax=Puccinia graminis f. sp. tritici TaxID=56615 RepID=A0A5B0QRM1_PUCGR|nr:hypothetical protein PGTUg99_021547 [Puccinia graminis f. sp. tritici]
MESSNYVFPQERSHRSGLLDELLAFAGLNPVVLSLKKNLIVPRSSPILLSATLSTRLNSLHRQKPN